MKYILFLSIITFGYSCSRNSNGIESLESADVSESEMYEEVSSNSADLNIKEQVVDRRIIWKADISFQVMNVDSSTLQIQSLVASYEGFVSSMELSSTNFRITNTFIIRVPNNQFEPLINELKKGSLYIDALKIESNDVTEEFVDIESRLKTKKEVRDRYIDILKNKAGTVKDVIEAEEAIREITEEIEAKEGRLRFLKDQVALSTIKLTIYQKVKFKEEPEIYEKPYVKKFYEGLENGWSIVTFTVLFLVNVWPVILVVALVYWRRKWILGKLRKQNN